MTWVTWFLLFSLIWLTWLIWFSLFLRIWKCFTIRKTRKYFTETKIFIKISIVFKKVFQIVREKDKIEKVVHEKFKLNVVNVVNQERFSRTMCKKNFKLCEKKIKLSKKKLNCVRKKLNCVGKKFKLYEKKFKLYEKKFKLCKKLLKSFR